MIVLWIILYIAIACIMGCFIYVQFEGEEDCDIDVIMGSIIWPVMIILIILYLILKSVCKNLVSFFRYVKTEGFHYCKEDVPQCCGQCKHMFYYNDHNELNGCRLKEHHSRFSSEVISCPKFRKSIWWRFRIRYKWDVKS
jgi:hypothetical protein